jgi:protein O-mannosyl-transferase
MRFSLFPSDKPSASSAPPVLGGRREHILAVLLLLAGLALIYGRTGGFDYVYYDDVEYVVGNAAVRAGLTWHGIVWAFTVFYLSNWHPLTWISHMIDVSLFGLKPGPAHLVNAAFHGVNSLLVYVLALRLLRNWRASLLVAYLFLAHPLHVESVAWIAERKDVLCAMFFLLSLLAYLRYAARPSGRGYALVAFVFVLALLSKPMAVTLPVVLLLLDFWPLGRLRAEPVMVLSRRFPEYAVLFAEKLPLFALSLASGLVTMAAQKSAIAPLHLEPPSYRLANVVVAYATYLHDTIIPTRLAFLYPLGPINFFISILPSLLILAAISAVAIGCRKKCPWLLFGWLWFLVMLLPVIGLIQVGVQSHADRYMYLPSIGLFLALGAAVARLSLVVSQKVLLALAPVLLFYSFIAWIQVGYWSNSYMLFTHVLDVVGESVPARVNLTGFYLRGGRMKEAEAEALKGVAASRGSPLAFAAYSVLGSVLDAKKDYAGAERAYRVALSKKPRDVKLLNQLGIVLEQEGRLEEARWFFAAALKLDPSSSFIRENLKRAGG